MPVDFRVGPWLVQPGLNTISQNGQAVRLEPKVLNVLVHLAARRGEVISKEELIKAVWPDAFVSDDTLTRCIYELRKALQDDVKNPKFIQTVPRRGYRLIPPSDILESSLPADRFIHTQVVGTHISPRSEKARFVRLVALAAGLVALASAITWILVKKTQKALLVPQHALRRLTFEPGLQTGATWSPDGRFLAYSSNQTGKFEIWLRQVDGSSPIQVTHEPGQNWQPDWSPDGKYIAYRSEAGSGGLYIVPALGGPRRKVADFGYYPKWSPDGSQLLFLPTSYGGSRSLYTVALDGGNPRKVLEQFFAEHKGVTVRSAAWYPDGARITVYTWDYDAGSPVFWTVPVRGGSSIRSGVDPALLKNLGDTMSARFAPDTKFSWNSSGTALYFEWTPGGAANLWKMKLNPRTWQANEIERLTTGQGSDAGVSISPDGNQLAFSGESRTIRIWIAPFDPVSGQLRGTGDSVTSPGVQAWVPTLSSNSQRLAFSGNRGSGQQIWEKALPAGEETPIAATDTYTRGYPIWSPDGRYLAYARWGVERHENEIVLWSSQKHDETVVADGRNYDLYGWSPDGKKLVVSKWNEQTEKAEVWLVPLARPSAPELIAASSEYYLFQGQVSPDGRWIAFEAVRDVANGRESTIYVVPAGGGAWIRITDSQQWDDKPRWSPDGKAIYFVSGRGGFYNVWGRRFNAARGSATGAPFRITDFDNPSEMIPIFIPDVGLSVASRRLAVTVSRSTGGLWVLSGVDH